MKLKVIVLLVLVLGTMGLSQTRDTEPPQLRDEFISTPNKPKPIGVPPQCPKPINRIGSDLVCPH